MAYIWISKRKKKEITLDEESFWNFKDLGAVWIEKIPGKHLSKFTTLWCGRQAPEGLSG